MTDKLDFETCMDANPKELDTKEIQACTVELLKSDSPSQVDKEILSMKVPKEKAGKMEFLKAYTRWDSWGKWREEYDDDILYEVEFQDTEDERVGEKVVKYLEEFNEREIGEDLPYIRQREIESSTLKKPYY